MNHTVLITGSSTGIGRNTAKYFHKKGWNVVATMRAPEKETEFHKMERMLVTRLDVEDVSSIDSAVAAGIAQFGRIDALLNNAGYGAYGPLESTPLEKIHRQFNVNVMGVLATTQALLPHFRQNRQGTILNVSSMGGKITFPLGTLYHGSKFAVEGLSEALHYELGLIGVRVKIIEPGAIQSDFAGRSFDFNNTPAIAEYQPLVQALFAAMGPMMAQAAPAELVAETIYRATTDNSSQLRYEVGADAMALLAGRRAADDATFLSGIKSQFGLKP